MRAPAEGHADRDAEALGGERPLVGTDVSRLYIGLAYSDPNRNHTGAAPCFDLSFLPRAVRPAEDP